MYINTDRKLHDLANCDWLKRVKVLEKTDLKNKYNLEITRAIHAGNHITGKVENKFFFLHSALKKKDSALKKKATNKVDFQFSYKNFYWEFLCGPLKETRIIRYVKIKNKALRFIQLYEGSAQS